MSKVLQDLRDLGQMETSWLDEDDAIVDSKINQLEEYKNIEKTLISVDNLRENLILKSYSMYDEFADRDYMVYEVKHKKDISPRYVSRDLFMLLKELTNEPGN